MTYPEAIQFLYGLQLFGAKLGLETTRRLAAAAGAPEEKLRFIHVAGTNGKGSTCAMLEAMYRESGRRVGLYTSPHLVSFRERIQVDRELISEADVVRLVLEMRRWIAGLPAGTHPTFFEVITVMALKYFEEQRCDVVIWETGLGGRLDATNIVRPLASVITNIQLDHERWLGNTIAEIAREKAGIIKPGVPVVTAAAEPDAVRVIAAGAAQAGAPLHLVADAEARRLPVSPALDGQHQRLNAAVAVRTGAVLEPVLPLPAGAIANGLQHVRWPGRFQRVARGSQTLLLDGAHNPAGARALADTMGREFPGQSGTLILGMLVDKNWEAICDALAPLARRIVVAPVSSPRTANPQIVAAACQAANPQADVRVLASACDLPSAMASDPLVLITGSLYFVGEALEHLGLSSAPNERALNEYGVKTEPGCPAG